MMLKNYTLGKWRASRYLEDLLDKDEFKDYRRFILGFLSRNLLLIKRFHKQFEDYENLENGINVKLYILNLMLFDIKNKIFNGKDHPKWKDAPYLLKTISYNVIICCAKNKKPNNMKNT